MKIGSKVIYGCDIVKILIINVNDFYLVKMLHPNDKGKKVRVHKSNLQII